MQAIQAAVSTQTLSGSAVSAPITDTFTSFAWVPTLQSTGLGGRGFHEEITKNTKNPKWGLCRLTTTYADLQG